MQYIYYAECYLKLPDAWDANTVEPLKTKPFKIQKLF